MPTGAIGWINTMPKNIRSLTVSSRFKRGCSVAADMPFCDGDEVMRLASHSRIRGWQLCAFGRFSQRRTPSQLRSSSVASFQGR